MRGNRRIRGTRIATRTIMARKKPRRSSSPRRGNWRSELEPDIISGRAVLFDGARAEDSPKNGEPSGD